MSDWQTAVKAYEHEFFPERFSNDALLHALKDETMPEDTRSRLATELVNRPTFDTEAAITQLGIEWWGDDPSGCRRASDAIKAVGDE